jgi:catechol 2,3-dioxygenase-like lactoylglutathione lyase family enzyme
LEIEIMNNPRINGVRSVELGVHDLQKSLEFYRNVWALEEVAGEGDTVHLRGTGQEHHVVTLRERPRAALLGVHFSAADRATVDALHAKAKAIGANVENAPGQLTADAGGGYGFQLRTPEGHPLSISSDVARHGAAIDDRARPTKLTHVVLNSAEVEKQTAFFLDVLGFKWSDSTFMMDFVRCCSDHHSVAFARGNGPSLNHMAGCATMVMRSCGASGGMVPAATCSPISSSRTVSSPNTPPRSTRLTTTMSATMRNGGRSRTCFLAAGTWPGCRPN